MTFENSTDTMRIVESLIRIEAQMKSITSSVEEIKKNITLGDGSTLRDSVKRVISEDIRERHTSCGPEMKSVAESSAKIAVADHIEKYHKEKRTSSAPKTDGFNWSKIEPVVMFLVKRVLPLVLAGGLGIGGMKALETPHEGTAQVSTKDK